MIQKRQVISYEYINPLLFKDKKQNFLKSRFDSLNFGNHKEAIYNFCKSLYEEAKAVNDEDLNEIMKSVSDAITDQIIRITEGQLISPWSSYAVGGLTANISNKVQDALIRNSQLGK